MDGRLFVAVILSLCPGIFGDSKLKTVRAFTGESVILPCVADDFDATTTVEWSKVGMPEHVLVYRQGCEIHKEKNPAFWYRSSLIMNELKNKNISVRISDVKLSDAGNYTCMTFPDETQWNVIELIVGAVSEPKLSVVPSTDARVTLQCEVQCWFPKPDVTFLDAAGKEMSAQNETTELRSEGCYNIIKRVTLETGTNSVTCKVNEPSLNQGKAEKFLVPDVCLTSCTHTIIITIVSAVIVCFSILCPALFYLKYKNRQRQRSSASAMSWRSEEGHTNDNSTAITMHPENNGVVPQPQTEQLNKENSSPREVNGNVSGSRQVLAQGSSTQRNPARFSHVRFDVAPSSDDEYDNYLSWPRTVKRKALYRSSTISGYRRSSSVTKPSEEEENLLSSTSP